MAAGNSASAVRQLSVIAISSNNYYIIARQLSDAILTHCKFQLIAHTHTRMPHGQNTLSWPNSATKSVKRPNESSQGLRAVAFLCSLQRLAANSWLLNCICLTVAYVSERDRESPEALLPFTAMHICHPTLLTCFGSLSHLHLPLVLGQDAAQLVVSAFPRWLPKTNSMSRRRNRL